MWYTILMNFFSESFGIYFNGVSNRVVYPYAETSWWLTICMHKILTFLSTSWPKLWLVFAVVMLEKLLQWHVQIHSILFYLGEQVTSWGLTICMHKGWSGGTKVSCILRYRGVQLILAYSWARPAILVAGKGRGWMFLFLLFLHFHSCSSSFSIALFHFYYLFYLFSPFLWETTQNDPQGLTCH